VSGPRSVWRLDLAYDGTPFSGWARQPDRRSVEGELERALATVLRERVRLRVAGRTDAGVHALAQVASFSLGRASLDSERIRLSLNSLLPPEIAVQAVTRVGEQFDARAADARSYRYRLWLPAARPVFERAYVWDVRGALEFAALQECAPLFVGHRDFSALTPSARFYKTCVRDIRTAVWRLGDGGCEAVFDVTGGSFLHNMVRVMVGTMVDVAQSRLSVADVARGLDGGSRAALGQTAPARGLALVAVDYRKESA
jgi:tRNA pseudouridine38-40 synthase